MPSSLASRLRRALIPPLLGGLTLPLHAQPSWAGSSGDVSDLTKWNNASIVPGASDHVVIGSGTATLSGNTNYGGLDLTGGTITGGNSTLSLGSVGTSTWTAGALTFSTGGGLSLASNTTLAISTGTHDFAGSAIANNGTINWSSGQLRTGSGGSITNNGTFNDAASDSISNAFGGTQGTFTNAGAYNKAGTGSTTIGLTFANQGNVTVNQGTLVLSGGGSNAAGAKLKVGSGAGLAFSGGNFTIASAGDIVDSGGSYAVSGGSVTVNAGTATLPNLAISGGSLSFLSGGASAQSIAVSGGALGTGTYTTSTLSQSGGSLANASVTVTGSGSAWTGGDMNGAGSLTLQNGADLTLSTGTHDFAQHTIANNGTIHWNSGQLRTGSGGSITNNGTFNDAASDSISNAFGGTQGTFTNAGAYNKAGTGSTTIGLTFANQGNVTVNQGTLVLSGGGSNAAGAKLKVGSGAGLAFSGGNFTIASAGDIIDSGGSYAVSGGSVTVNAGTATLPNLAISGGSLSFLSGGASAQSIAVSGGALGTGTYTTSTLNQSGGSLANASVTVTGSGSAWTGGDMNGAGSLTLQNGADLTLSTGTHDFAQHTIANNGTINWSSGQLRTGSGGSITNNGTFNDAASDSISNAFGGTQGTFTNGGTYNKNGAGTTTIGLTFANNGALNVANGTLVLSGGGSSSAAITTSSTATTTFAADYAIGHGGALNGSGHYALTGGTLSVSDNGSVANLAQSGGTLAPAGTLTISRFDLSSGTVGGTVKVTNAMTWTNGSMNTAGTTTLGGNVTLNLDDTTSTVRDFNGHAVINQGTVNWSSAHLRSGGGGSFTNDAGATFNDTNAAGYTIAPAFGGAFTFTNNGTYNRNASGTTYVDATFDNNGTVNVQQGNLELRNGGTMGGNATVNAAAGTNVYFRNGGRVQDGAAFTGGGAYWLTGGTLTVSGALKASGFTQTAGLLAGINTIIGTFGWNGGSWSGSAGDTTTIDSTSTITLSDASDTTRDFNGRAITNHGMVNWEGGQLRSGSGGSFTNASNGVFNDHNTRSYGVENPFGGTFTFINDGTYAKSSNGTTSFQIDVTNHGTIAISAGRMVFNGAFTGNGTLALSNAATLQFGSAVALPSAMVAGTGTINAPAFSTGGVVAPGNPLGLLTFTGNFTLLNTSILLIELGGTTRGTNYDALDVGGAATLAGLLNVSFANGFNGAVLPGNTFTLLSAGSLSGAFSNAANGQRLFTRDGLGSFQVNYGVNSVTLTNFQAVPEPSTWALLGAGVLALGWTTRRRRRTPAR